MGIKDWLIHKLSNNTKTTVNIDEIVGNVQELYAREMAFETCVNMIANAVGKCKIKTYRSREPTKEKEYYLWNIQPNINQNSTEFMHILIKRLYKNNEVVVVSIGNYEREQLYIADTFRKKDLKIAGEEEVYTDIVVNNIPLYRDFRASEIIHLTLNDGNIKFVIDNMYESYKKLLNSLSKNIAWKNGKHLKVNVEHIATRDEKWLEAFHDIINNQVKPFLESENAVLPEFDGYKYEFLEDLNSKGSLQNTRDIRAMIDDIYSYTANAFGIPPVLLLGSVEGTKDAMKRWLTTGIDPLCNQLSQEITRARYNYKMWASGTYIRVDTSSIIHFDLFDNASNVEKIVGSGTHSIDDVREASGLERLDEEWSKKHYMTLNITGIKNATKDTITEGGEKNEIKK